MKQLGADFSNKKKNKQDINKNKRENIKFDNLLHQTEEYRLFELKTKIEQNATHIPINTPTMCPICGRLNVEGYFKLKIKNKEDIKIFLCYKHYMFGKKPSLFNNKIDIILILSLLLFSISGILIFMITQNLSIFTVILLLNSIPLFVYIFRKIIEISKYNLYIGNINEYVRLGFLNDSIVIRIKNSDWESEFKRLNDWKEIPYNSEEIKGHRRSGLKLVIILILWVIISIPVTILSSVSFPIYSKLIVYFFIFIPIFIIILMLLFHITKEQALKNFTLSQSKRRLFIILYFLLILLITLDFFDVFKIF